MMRCLFALSLVLTLLGFAPTPASAGDFEPDPRSVQRYGPAYRYPQAGWIVLHIEGEPYARGCQHGRLLAEEIAAHVRCFANVRSPKAPADAWKATRTLVDALFLRRYHKEYLEEMKGIAAGASAAGARFDGRPLDLLDIVALNSWSEIETLPFALAATPTGLEGARFPLDGPQAKAKPQPMHCSAFAANGKATRDGKIVFGHITMTSQYPAGFYNVWLDVKPARGHRVFMQTYPGGMQSGLDYYFNDAGLLVCETTLAQTCFDIKGMTVASRIRQALQYADSIDKAVEILQEGNNGLYTNEWLLADIKTNEIAMFELGTHKNKLYRSSKNEWYGDTEGFYWGCNNTKDLQVRLETIASVEGRPAVAVFRPSERDKKWLALYDQHKGTMDAAFGKLAFTTPPLAAYHSVDAKFTTTELARDLKTWALFGPPLGRTWEPTFEERQRYADARPLVSNPWAILHAKPPKGGHGNSLIVDLPDPMRGGRSRLSAKSHVLPPTVAAWHGTLLPHKDADIWLATGFANYEKIAALNNALRKRADDGKLTKGDHEQLALTRDKSAVPALLAGLTKEDREQLALTLFAYRANYELGSRARTELPLALTHADLRNNDWYRVAAGKGVWLLHSLRGQMGSEAFDAMMEAFGREHAGKAVRAAQFQAHVEKWIGNQRADLFDAWLNRTGLPRFEVAVTGTTSTPKGHEVSIEVRRDKAGPQTAVDVTVETNKGEVTRTVRIDGTMARLVVETSEAPLRVVLDKYGQTAKSNGGPFSVLTYQAELEQTLIVYGTTGERATNHEAAEALQEAILERGWNITVGIRADTKVSDEELKSHHLLVIGRPDTNALMKRCQKTLPISFGTGSFAVREEVYAHPDSAVLAAAENPFNKRYSMVVVAGLGAASTLRTAPHVASSLTQAAEVVVLPHGGATRALVLPAKELVCEVKEIVSRKEEAKKR
ncbi:MAG TPA: C45 family autoproteolytic acyltransferase/hydrolase [Gemmataceae bacterium]|nr:C45 family autoproteolytic acyltransferase/hydrolase [Gemmataceae bacterium]